MTTITLEVPDELAQRLMPLRAQLPQLLARTLEMAEQMNVTHTFKTARRAALADAHAIGERIRRWQIAQGVGDVSSMNLLEQLRTERMHELDDLR